jgi:CHAT domain-containing protein
MFRHFVLLLFLLLIIFFPYSQEHHEMPDYFSVYRSAEKFYNSEQATRTTDSLALLSYLKVISLLNKKGVNDSILFDSYMKSGILEMSANRDQHALELFSGSIRVLQSSSTLPDSLLFKSYLYAGSSYYNLNNLDSASYCYKKAEELINIHPTLTESERLYNKSGALYYETGDYKKSIQYFSKALSLVEHKQTRNAWNPYFIVNYKNNIASAMRKLGDYEQAMDLYKSLLPYNISKNELLHNIGVTYLSQGNYPEAIHYLKQVGYGNQVKYNDIGHAYLQLKKYDSSSYFLDAAVNEYRKISTKQKNIDYVITLKYQGDILMETHDPAKAISYYQRAIIQTDPDFNDTAVEKNPVAFRGLHNSFFLFDALIAKGAAFNAIHASAPDTLLLAHAFSAYSSAIRLSRQVEKTFSSDEAKLFLGNNVNNAYKELVEIGIRLYDLSKNKIYLQKAFNYADNSKASVLQSSLHDLSLESIDGLPQGLLKEEKNLKALIAKLNIQLATITDNTQLAEMQQKINDLEIRLSLLQEKLDENPKYHQLKFDSRDISMEDLQQKILKQDAALISFYYLKNRLICFYVTKEEYGYNDCPLQGDLQKNIFSTREMLRAVEGHDNRSMQGLIAKLFAQLVQPVFEKINNKKRLIIIPHNEISYIPFEILTEPKSDQPLLKKFAISYNYSANFFTEKETADKKYEALAMAPFAGISSNSFPDLKESRGEIESLKGKILFGQEATKQNFVEFSASYPVIHLATHAVADDADPLRSFIEFYGSKNDLDTAHRLFEQEIYHLDMKTAKLVVLSACETGTGHLINGEGIMSLSRAFSYAGCKSVITSLWKADDAATAFISRKLHEYLQKGFEKDEALQKAKTDYLESDRVDAIHKTPAYWAHLVLIGDAQAIEKKGNGLMWIIGGIFVLLIVLYIIRRTVIYRIKKDYEEK